MLSSQTIEPAWAWIDKKTKGNAKRTAASRMGNLPVEKRTKETVVFPISAGRQGKMVSN
jgi:hypothetical protein